MPDYRPRRLPLGLQRRDTHLQLRDFGILALDREACDVPALGDALGAEIVFVKEVDELGFDCRRQGDRREDPEG